MLDTLVKQNNLKSLILPRGEDAIKFLNSKDGATIRVVVMDMMLDGMNGLDAFRIIARDHPQLPVIFLTAVHNERVAIDAFKVGAFEYHTKPYDPGQMILAIRNAFRLGDARCQIEQLKWTTGVPTRLSDLIGHHQGLSNLVTAARRVANSKIPVLIMGETGVGKEVLARAIHGESDRRDKPFVAINCGAIPEQLIESILFGHEKGAFTGATEKTPGKFREADGGTIFLDEVGEMPLSAQTRLLRVLQENEIEPVGSAKTIPINVRVLSATNRDLTMMIGNGRFREDLYFRLNVVPLTIPPLRQRRMDIPLLAQHFIDRFVATDHLPRRALSDLAALALARYDWPGNVRELENTIRRALVLTDGPDLKPEDFIFHTIRRVAMPPRETGAPVPPKSELFFSLQNEVGHIRTIAEMERDILHIVLKHHNGNITVAARTLGIAKSTYYRKLAKVNG